MAAGLAPATSFCLTMATRSWGKMRRHSTRSFLWHLGKEISKILTSTRRFYSFILLKILTSEKKEVDRKR
jgi:hypothetical protein